MKPSEILLEIICLKIFIIDFAVYQKLGNNDKKEKILDAFYEEIKEWQADRSSFFEVLELRLAGYAAALKGEDTDIIEKLGPGYPIGKVFAEYCGVKDDFKIIMLGCAFFSEHLIDKMEFIDKYQNV